MSINLAAVCVRGGSAGVPGKNRRDFLGKSLVERAIEFAKSLSQIDRVVCSTDSEIIADIALRCGADVPELRPQELSASDSAKPDVWKHIIDRSDAWFGQPINLFCDFDATNPIKSKAHFTRLYETMIHRPEFDGALLIKTARKNPYFNLLEFEAGKLAISKRSDDIADVVARQQAPSVYEHVASMYVFRPDYLVRTKSLFAGNVFGYEVPDQFSFDIDSEFDWGLLEYLYKEYGKSETEDENFNSGR